MTYILFILGIYLLIQGANWLVSGGSSLAKKLRIPSLVVGMTIVAFGTSAPEFFVSLIGAFKGQTDLVLGNIIGSNIINVVLVLGIATIFSSIKVKSNTAWKEIPFS